jgi:hypothetical protein
MQQRSIRTMDFAKNRTEFSQEFERKRELLFLELQQVVVPRGLFSRLIYAVAKKPFIWN